jgi:hypothetical protein
VKIRRDENVLAPLAVDLPAGKLIAYGQGHSATRANGRNHDSQDL